MNINKYSLSYIKQDIFGGITAAVVALPLGLAFGVSSGMGALTGLYGAIFVGFFASLFGGTPKQISGPTGPMTVIVALIFIEFNFRPEIVFFCIFLSGFFQILFGIFKLGDLVKKIPLAVVSGFMTGIGVIIICLQLPVLLGLGNESSIVKSLIKLQTSYNLNFQSVFLGSLCLLGLFFIPIRISKIVPLPILVLCVGTIVSFLFFYNQDLIGNIPQGIPKLILIFPAMEEMPKIIFYAILLAMLGTIDSLLTSVIADQLTGDQHKPNKETIGQGIGNIFSGLFGGLAGAGATMRTVVNIKAGGQTKFSGIVHSLILLLTVLVLSPIASTIPLSVLAAILVKVGIDIVDWEFFKNLRTKSRLEILTTFLVIFLTVFINLIIAVFAGVLFYFILKLILNKD
jgi:SulP family sulfate permease